ncbi:ATPase, T2SS/T4P/T4SS family [Pseudoduganella namucuonensis]|uniref:Twitching motility protein PilT n=1 Tax=Pseudoduganella namucuonensis TaxID=1035707 RepID=A0A1I7L7U1_9BURK|nr:ATPase, T2SS/T4P/T4SS family [Pseudoduganella namucuonensis]SFV05799.1 twitching motility protein PilT [Pseudoduganella namucuonensis]
MRSNPTLVDVTTANNVRELEFSDLYLGHPALQDRVADVPGAAFNPLPAGPLLRDDLARLTVACTEQRSRAPDPDEFKVAYDGACYRVATMPARAGDVFVVRRMATAVSSLAELGVPQAYIRRMMMPGLSGLFIVSGAIKSGKTMTAGAMLKDRLGLHGGVAVTGENPIELPLEGLHGHGVCFQTLLPREPGALPEAMRNIMRWRAGTILIGEIRDEESATELLKASFNGYLVITTMLAEDVVQTVTRLNALLGERRPGNAHALLAEGLLGVLHQQIVHGARHAPRLETEFLFLKDAPVTRAVLRKGEFELLTSEMRRQMAEMIGENASARRFVPG